MKQSIYRFRLADPKIFRDYARRLARRRAARPFRFRKISAAAKRLLDFVNSVFSLLMRERNRRRGLRCRGAIEIWFAGDPRAVSVLANDSVAARGTAVAVQSRPQRNCRTGRRIRPDELADLDETEKEARLLAMRLTRIAGGTTTKFGMTSERLFRAVEWRDMAVLLRAPSGKAEIYAKEFERAGVPLVIARGGFYDSRKSPIC